MSSKRQIEAKKMLQYLKKEEEAYTKMLDVMKKQTKKLEIEELLLKSSIRKDKIRLGLPLDDELLKEVSETDTHLSPGCSTSNEAYGHWNKIDSKWNEIEESLNETSHKDKSSHIKNIPRSTTVETDANYQNNLRQASPTANNSGKPDEKFLECLILSSSSYADATPSEVEFDDCD